MKRGTQAALFLVAVITVAVLLLAIHAGQHWWAVHTGTVNEAGPFYGFWSGFGSDIGEATLVVGVISGVLMAYRKINCHEPTCKRIGLHPTHDGMFHLCRHHHPDLAGCAGKKPDLEFIHQHHHESRARASGSVGTAATNTINVTAEVSANHLEAMKAVLRDHDEALINKIRGTAPKPRAT